MRKGKKGVKEGRRRITILFRRKDHREGEK
jgi:hypothetical protein